MTQLPGFLVNIILEKILCLLSLITFHSSRIYDTITIGNSVHHKVYLLKGFDNYVGPEEGITHILYSFSEGILKLSSNKNNVWILQKS